MNVPRIGIGLPTFGPHAGPDAITLVARAAERFGYHAVSVSERLLMPVSPTTALKDGLPESHVWDPLEALTWAAAHTDRIRVMSGVVNSIFQPPIVLARRLATLDRLSRGRLDAGIGQGGGGTADSSWMIPEEFEAAGVPLDRRGAGFVEHVAAMRACWRSDPVEFDGAYYRIPNAAVGPKPWADTIPLYFGAMVRSTIERAATLADGFVTVALDWDETRTRVGWYRDAGGSGTVVVNTFQLYPGGEPDSPTMFIDAVLADLDRAAKIGADDMHITLNLASVHPERQVELLGALADTLGRGTQGPPSDSTPVTRAGKPAG
ncbi:TIGR03619 family F420-dependent LLM class oxidoreductase [Nocardia noduli]|uniref:TIGR03619 family F420-dependent LLM class oxidoreductase n=1 Tax=Nocardia noduli TaxID=2815722 RepID=UPI001C22EAC2|nr:TIGR03619 family F420-dependent LLM class oxidoreductase [Nocardia noduli]